MNSRKLELFGKAAANQFYKLSFEEGSGDFAGGNISRGDIGPAFEPGAGDFAGGIRAGGSFGAPSPPVIKAPAAASSNSVPTSTNPLNSYLQPFLQPIQQMMGGGFDISKLGPYMGLLAPIFKGIGGMAGLPGVAGVLNMLRGGQEINTLGRGMFEGYDTRDPDAGLRQQYAQQNRQQAATQQPNVVRIDPNTGKSPVQHPAFKPIPGLQPPAPQAPAQQPAAPVPTPTPPPSPTPVKLPKVQGVPKPPTPPPAPTTAQPASPS